MLIEKTWAMRWDDIRRYVIFPDTELAMLMMIPDGTNIITWSNKFFVDSTLCTELVKDEDVRVLWGEAPSAKTGNPNVNNRRLEFDIYVKREHLNDATNDLLQSRARLISQKLQEILTSKELLGQMVFRYVDDYSIGTKMVGYVRHR